MQSKHFRKLMQLVEVDRLGEDVGHLLISLNESPFNFTIEDTLAHKMIMHMYVLCASMEARVLGKLNTSHVVAINRNRVGDMNM